MGFVTDDSVQVRPIGFDFEFYGTVETHISIDTNGNLTFDNLDSNWGGQIPFFDQPRMIAPLYADLSPNVSGAVYFNLVGEAPNRRLIVTWVDVPHRSPVVLEGNTFQVQLFEATNQIQFGYNGLSDATNLGDVGIARDAGEYLVTARDEEVRALDMANVCYSPEDDTYHEELGPCSPCPNEAYFRDEALAQLQTLWVRSNPRSAPPQSSGIRSEVERGGWIIEVGEEQFSVVESAYSGTSCHMIPQMNPPDFDPPPEDAVAYFHTHPLPTGFEYDCGERGQAGQVRKWIPGETGPSGGDNSAAKFYRDQGYLDLRFYIVEINFGVYEYYWTAQGDSIQRRFPGCIEEFNGS